MLKTCRKTKTGVGCMRMQLPKGQLQVNCSHLHFYMAVTARLLRCKHHTFATRIDNVTCYSPFPTRVCRRCKQQFTDNHAKACRYHSSLYSGGELAKALGFLRENDDPANSLRSVMGTTGLLRCVLRHVTHCQHHCSIQVLGLLRRARGIGTWVLHCTPHHV